MPLVTLEQLKGHLKITHADEDRDLELKLQQATSLVLHYLKRTDLGSPLETDTSLIEPSELTTVERAIVQAAIMKVAANFDRFRGDEAEGDNPSTQEFLTSDIRGILSMLRDPAIA